MEVQHNNTTYVLNTEKAIQLGVLIKKKRKIRLIKKKRKILLPDIKNGTIFKWVSDIAENCCYLMVNNSPGVLKQCIALDEHARFTFFADTENFAILDEENAKWVAEID